MQKNEAYRLLYDARDERDACGVGFVANVSGKQDRGALETALEALRNLEHRGAVGADGRTGDGAGLLTQLPLRFFSREVERLGFRAPSAADLAVGMFFLPRDNSAAASCRAMTEQAISRHGLMVICWRPVPVDENALGPKALAFAPVIEQLLIGRGRLAGELETTLRLVRREIEAETSGLEGFYIASLSNRTMVYKGMLVAGKLEAFYPDLGDPLFETALAVLHQRYSTNTFPNWRLAQPFRLLAHNGEINTVAGNRNWMRARENDIVRREPHKSYARSRWNEGSDSSSLDKALDMLVSNGFEVSQAMMTLIPEAYENSVEMEGSLRAFYEYSSCVMEAWDGPAAVAFTDGKLVGAALDRNGLRPARYALTTDGRVILTSEAGATACDVETVIEKGRLGPGEMIAVDTERGLLLRNDAIKRSVAANKPYASWVRRSIAVCKQNLEDQPGKASGSDSRSREGKPHRPAELLTRMRTFGYTAEDVQRILEPMLLEAKEPAGSMGDDTPLAVLSEKPRLFYSYFKQRFAQVTNPPIDSMRERQMMSLDTLLGERIAITDQTPLASLVRLASPVLSDATLGWLKQKAGRELRSTTLNAVFELEEGAEGLKCALDELCERAHSAIDAGVAILIISDLAADDSRAPIPMLLAVGALHNYLVRVGRRLSASLIAQTAEARDDHQIACLIGFGANAVNPALAFKVIAHEADNRGLSRPLASRNYRIALENGLLKIMAKMGIATAASYCGSGTFEAVGLDAQLVETYFTGAVSRAGGIGLAEICVDVSRFCRSESTRTDASLEDAGYFRYRNGGEYHSYNPTVFRALHRAARSGGGTEYNKYAGSVVRRGPAVLRDLFEFRGGKPIDVNEVEPAERILERCSTSGMSLGALSKEAHETLAIAMNRLGSRSNSGEGGEDPRRFKRRPDGDLANSRIKQIASGRFGVTPEYLISADELEIKMAQGSKPGEGGQLPGHKVTAEIAALRHSVRGETLISPPPHHDIYSIEDLAQLIYDLKQINPEARIAVKLVSEAGIGTIAAGVAKAHADVIHVSGHDGGTGASPLGSIKNAGTPWELGLAETQQALVLNDLRSRVRLRVDGGLKTGRDILTAAMLGAEEFGFATAAVVAMGCVMARQCHLTTCPVGVATQDTGLRRKFKGSPENVMIFFRSLAQEIRELLATLGVKTLEEIIGRSDLLTQKDVSLPRNARLDLSPILNRADDGEEQPLRFDRSYRLRTADSLGERVERDCAEAVERGIPYAARYEIRNTDRALGARLAGTIARRYGDAGLATGTIELTFDGSAGQSFGAFNIAGVKLRLMGEANDYVGKGMSGGEIIIRPAARARFTWSQNVIAGNTVMYGATGGALFAAGRAGERFCVRNSGGTAVVEGVGDHGCEYMTGGVVVVLGEVGRNFAAGMTGGVAYVFDELGNFRNRCNNELVCVTAIGDYEEQEACSLIERHCEATGSPLGFDLLKRWQASRTLMLRVAPFGEAAPDAAAAAPRVSITDKLGVAASFQLVNQ
jgi:glutamate synthase domain-containing protein 2/glutamate synthase domain-containing protein 1/glutamate synthase domain-containing protein 3